VETRETTGNVNQISQAVSTFATRQSWPWDKAFMIAAAYLAEHGWVAEYEPATNELECPAWIGLDRHTELGKLAIAAVAEASGIHRKIVEWTGFYFESALMNTESARTCGEIDWWQEEKHWRLGLLGISPVEGENIWASLRDQVREKIEGSGRAQLEHLNRVKETRPAATHSTTTLSFSGLWDE